MCIDIYARIQVQVWLLGMHWLSVIVQTQRERKVLWLIQFLVVVLVSDSAVDSYYECSYYTCIW